MRTLRILSTVACALLGLAFVASAGEAAPRHTAHARKASHKVVAAKPAHRTLGSAGLVVAIDQESGQYRMPTAEELRALYVSADDPLNYTSDDLVAQPTPKGGLWLDVQGRFREYSVARVGKDGKVIIGCGDSPSGALQNTSEANRPSGNLEVK